MSLGEKIIVMNKNSYLLLFVIIAIFSNSSYALNGDLGLLTDPSVDGSSDHPWLIEDFADFQSFCNDSSKWAANEHVRLEVDLNLDPELQGRQIYNKAPIAGDNDSTAIHLQGPGYYGYFDGNGHTISNLNISGHDYCGLFGVTFAGAIISNLGVINVNILCADSSTCLGGLVGQNSGTISKCYSTGLIKGTSGSHLTATAHIGGLVGWNEAGSVSNSYSTAAVIGGAHLGGLVGVLNGGSIDKCYSSGAIASWYYSYPFIGGLAATNNGGTVTNSVWNIQSSGLTASAAGNPATDAQMKDINIFLNAGWDFDFSDSDIADWYIGGQGYPLLYYKDSLSGAGTETNPYIITNLIDFYIFTYPYSAGKYWSAGVYIRLDADLDLAGLNYAKAPIAADIDNINNDFQGIAYAGCFDGNGHIISNLSVSGHDYCNLFGKTATASSISNLGVINVNISGRNFRGALVGENSGTINNCYSTGLVGSAVTWCFSCGGLVGKNLEGKIINCYSQASVTGNDNSNKYGGLVGENLAGVISNCYSTGAVNGFSSSEFLGGLVGTDNFGTIINCYSTSSVTARQTSRNLGGLIGGGYKSSISNCSSTGLVTAGNESSSLGGLAGKVMKTNISVCYSASSVEGGSSCSRLGGFMGESIDCGINNCYSTGSVSCGQSTYLGGFAGENYGPDGIVSNCYSTGAVSCGLSASYLGGLIGENANAKVINCYCTGAVYGGALGNSCLGGLVGSNSYGMVLNCFWDVDTCGITVSDGGIGLPTAQMQNENNFLNASWDFSFADGDAAQWQMGSVDGYPLLLWALPGTGTEGDPFIISSLADFQKFCKPAQADLYWAAGVYTRLETDLNLDPLLPCRQSYSHSPIAPDTDSNSVSFQGIAYSGHFDGNGHTISKLTINGNDYCGLFGKTDAGCEISNLAVVDVSITGLNYLGGLVGFNRNSGITDCYSIGLIAGGNDCRNFGGLVGYNGNSDISNCYFVGSVTGGDSCYSFGGLIGEGYNSDINNCYFSGMVTVNDASHHLGGLLGASVGGAIKNCYSTGSVACGGNAVNCGGLVGWNKKNAISNCYSICNMTGPDSAYLGGMIGRNIDGAVSNCYSVGLITTGGNSISPGGFVGYSSNAVVGCFWDTETSGMTTSASGTGLRTAEMQDRKNFLIANWDFNAELDNGTDNIWHMPYQATGFPMLWWQRDIPGDTMGSYGVDMHDFAELSKCWLNTGGADISDLIVLAQNWLADK